MPKVEIYAKENGPLVVSVDGQIKMALCRCGKSNNKPYCDGSHHKLEIQFMAEPKRLDGGRMTEEDSVALLLPVAMAIGNIIMGKILEQLPRIFERHVPYSIRQERKIRWAMGSMFSMA